MLSAYTKKSYQCLRNSQKQLGDVHSFKEVFISCFCASVSQVNQQKDWVCPIFQNYFMHLMRIMQQCSILSEIIPGYYYSIYFPSLFWVFAARPSYSQLLSSTVLRQSFFTFQVIAIFLFPPSNSVWQICLSSCFQCSPLSTSTKPASF